MINWELTVGNIATIITIAASALIFIVQMKGKLELLNQSLVVIDRRLTAVESAVSLISQATVQLAKQEIRLDILAKEVESLKKR